MGRAALKYEHYENFQEMPIYEAPSQLRPLKKRSKKVSINPVYTLLIMFAIIAMSVICVAMLKAQFTVADTSDRIISLKHELNDIRRVNEKLEANIKESMDLTEIRRIAMEEFGMVLRSDTNTFFIKEDKLTFTEQFAPIRVEEKEKLSVGNVLGLISRDW